MIPWLPLSCRNVSIRSSLRSINLIIVNSLWWLIILRTKEAMSGGTRTFAVMADVWTEFRLPHDEIRIFYRNSIGRLAILSAGSFGVLMHDYSSHSLLDTKLNVANSSSNSKPNDILFVWYFWISVSDVVHRGTDVRSQYRFNLATWQLGDRSWRIIRHVLSRCAKSLISCGISSARVSRFVIGTSACVSGEDDHPNDVSKFSRGESFFRVAPRKSLSPYESPISFYISSLTSIINSWHS